MPRRFVFALQRVLDYRLQQEERAKVSFAEAQKSYNQQKAFIENLENEFQDIGARVSSQQKISANELWLWKNYQERVTAELEIAKRSLKDMRKTMQARREDLLQKSKERKKLEKLKQNREIRYENQKRQEEQKWLDEIGTQVFIRKTE